MRAAPRSSPRSRSAAWAARRRSPPPCCGCALTRQRSRSATPWSSTAGRPREGTERDDPTALDDRRARPHRRGRRAPDRAAGARDDAAARRPLRGRRVSERRQKRRVVLAIILAGYLLVLIDVSILMAALPSIRAELGFSETSLSWAQNAYTLAFGGLLLLGARAGDLLGRRRTFVLGIGLFTAASLAVGLAQSPAWMIAARAVQGIGAAVLAPSTLALLSTSFPEGTQRTRAMAAYGALAGIGTSIGLILGGALTETLSWRYGFFLNLPVGIAAILAAPRYLDETEQHPGR